MTNSSPWKITMLLIGKPSIPMGHLYHGYVSHNQRVDVQQPHSHFSIGGSGCWTAPAPRCACGSFGRASFRWSWARRCWSWHRWSTRAPAWTLGGGPMGWHATYIYIYIHIYIYVYVYIYLFIYLYIIYIYNIYNYIYMYIYIYW